MSEYQFYEFKAIDNPLSKKDKEIISSWSSRTDASNAGATFEYHYGDFPKDELKVVEKYFDAMFYISNWGTRQLVFKFPNDLIDIKKLMHYSAEGIELIEKEKFTILHIFIEDEDGGGNWIEGDGYLSSLISLRADILSGDYRCLYLIWLKITTEDVINEWDNVDPESEEADVPANLQSLNAALLDFVDVFEIDKDTIAAASKNSIASLSENNNEYNEIASLSDAEKNDFLKRLLQNEALLNIKLQKRLKAEKSKVSDVNKHNKRSIKEIVAATIELKEKRKNKEKQKREEKRIAKLKEIEKDESNLWGQVDFLIKQKNTKSYEEAIKIMQNLKMLSIYKNQNESFCRKIENIKQDYKRLTGLIGRIDYAKLLKATSNN